MEASDEDLFDYLYSGQNNPDDIYDDILDPDANKTMLAQIKALEEKVKNSDQQMTLLKSQISVLTNLNKDLREKNVTCEKNLSSLIVTARTEINRKNEQITSLRKELDDVLFRRSARNINKKELDDILSKHKSSSCAGCTAKIILPNKRKRKPGSSHQDKKDTACGVRAVTVNVSVGNRQVPTKKKRKICEDNLDPPTNQPKKIKLSEEGEKKSEKNDAGVKVVDVREKWTSDSGHTKTRDNQEKTRSLEKLSNKEIPKSPERRAENESNKIDINNRERHKSSGSSGSNENLDHSKWWCEECEIGFLKRALLRQHRRDVQCKVGIRRSRDFSEIANKTTRNRGRSGERGKSGDRVRRRSADRGRGGDRKSQSLSPERQRKVKVNKDLKNEPNTQREQIPVENTEDSLEALEKQRNAVLAQLAAMESEEEGQVVESEDEIIYEEIDEIEFSHLKSKDYERGRTRTPSGGKVAKKLPRLNCGDPLIKEKSLEESQNKSSDTSKEACAANERNNDKEKGKDRRKKKKDRRGLRDLGDSSCSSSADDLHEVSTEDLDNKIIPFKKRQFKELQFEATLIQAKIEAARRSKSNTPVHTTEGAALDQIPIITESSFSGIKCHGYASPQPSTYSTPPTVSQENLTINVSNEELPAAIENTPKVSPVKGISNLLKTPIVASNPIPGSSPTLPDNTRKLNKAVMATENDENALQFANIQVQSGNIPVNTKGVPKESRNVSSPNLPVIQEDISRDSVASGGSGKKMKRKLPRSQVSSVSAKGGGDSSNELKCDNCHLVFPNKNVKNRHMMCRHCQHTCINLKNHKYCLVCEKCYTEGISPHYICDVCEDKCFKDEDERQKHKSAHTWDDYT